MRGLLLGAAASLAAIFIPAAPAGAEPLGFTGGLPTLQSHFVSGGHRDGVRHDRRRHRRFDGAAFVYDRDYQGDTAWRHDSFNDWWHERPHRSHPAWMSRNQNCERVYWSGGGWTC